MAYLMEAFRYYVIKCCQILGQNDNRKREMKF